MGLLRRKNEELGGSQYRMREKLFAFGDDYWIETADGRRVFKIDGKALRLRSTLRLERPSGEELFTIQEKMLHLRDTMKVEHDGHTIATVKKALISPLRERFTIDVEGRGELQAKGNIVDHEYTIERDGETVGQVSKRWFRARDTYGIDIAPGEDDALMIAAAVCIDQMTHDAG